MSIHQQTQINQYQLTLLYVKMKIKFPCKMRLQHCGNTITDQISSNDQNKFVFNQDVIIKEQADKHFLQININLITEKGSKYVSGLLKLDIDDLTRSEGEKIIAPLTKCLDSEAFCELKVSKVKSGKLSKRVSVSSTLIQINKDVIGNNFIQNAHQKLVLSPKAKKSLIVQTRSQFGFGNNLNSKNQQWDQTRSKGPAHTLIYKSSFMKSPQHRKPVFGQTKLFTQINNEHETVSQRDKFAESEVYKQGYDKLKQKYKKQAELAKTQMSKRLNLQANENNYKIQIMRLRLKTDQQQKIISQKNDKIKSLQVQITEIQKQQLDMNYLKQQNNNLQHKVELLNDTINDMKRENQQLKRLSLQRTQADQSLIKQLRFQLDSFKVKIQNVTTQTQDIIRQKNQQILSLSSQIKLKVQQIEGQKNQIQKLQSHIHSKLYQFQKTLQAQKNNSTSKVNELRSKIQQLQRQKKSIQIDLTQSKNQRQKMKGLVLKVEYDKKVLVEEQKALRTQLLQLKSVKQKNSELNRQLLFFQDDKKNLQKQLQSTVQSKQINLQQITEQYQTKINYYKKQLKQLQEKSKIISSKIIQVQSQLEVSKNFQQKQKRIIDSQGSEITDLKNKQKQLKNYSASLQHQNLSLQNQISSSSNKLKYSQQTNRIQVQKFKEVLQKTKNELASQNLKCLQLFESKSNLQMELGKNKIQLQYSQQKIDKLSTINKQLSSKIDHMTKQHETSIKQFQQIIQRHQKRQKQHNQKIHASELQKINTTETIQTLKKELKINQEKINHLQSNLKSKQEDHLSIQSSLRQLQKKSLQQDMQFSTLRHDHSILKNQKHKLEKILQLKNVDIQDRKKQIKKFQAQKGKLQNIQLELRERIKKQNQSHVKTQMRLKTVEKQFQKFREVLFSTIKTEYAKIPVLERKQENSPVSSKSLQILKDQIPFTNIILSTLVNNVGDSRLTVNKLIQHNKQLKKQIQRLSQQSQQTNNKFQFSSLQFHRDIQQLEEQLQIVYNQKQEQIINYDNIVSDLNCKLYEKDNLISQLNLQCEQLQYALSSLKLDFQTNNDQNDKKISALKSTIHELQEKIQYINMNLANQQDRNQQLQDKLQILKTQKSQSFDSLTKKIVQIQNLQSIKIKYQNQLYQLKQQRKQLRQSISQLQIALSTQKELLQINKEILNNQQKKNQELKEFQSTLMKEKQAIIKIELEKSEQLLQSQTQLIQLKLDYQILSEDHFRQKAQSEQFKQLSKKQSNIIKSKQQELSQQTNKSLKLVEKLKQKQKQLLMKQEVISRLDIKYRELAQSNYKSSLALHDQLDSKYQQNINITSELNQKITLLQAQVVELQHMKTKQHHEYVMQSDELLAEKQHIQLLKRQIKRLEEKLQQSCEQCKSQEFKSQQLNKQIKDRQEEACQLNNQIVVLQGELQALAKDKSRRLQQLNKQWQIKYQNMLQQEQQKVQILEKQREYLRERFSQKESQLNIAIHQTKSIQTSLVDIKKNYEQKVKKLQSDRLTTILQKNNQLKKLQNQNKSLVQSSRVLQNSVQQLNQILQTTKQKLLGQQRKYTQLQQKQKTLKKLHQSQIQSLNRKQSLYKSYKQTLNQLLYSNQRQVRKVLQNYIKKIMDVCEANKVDQIAKVSKGLQTAIATAMMAKLELTK